MFEIDPGVLTYRTVAVAELREQGVNVVSEPEGGTEVSLSFWENALRFQAWVTNEQKPE